MIATLKRFSDTRFAILMGSLRAWSDGRASGMEPIDLKMGHQIDAKEAVTCSYSWKSLLIYSLLVEWHLREGEDVVTGAERSKKTRAFFPDPAIR
jgi:hypothetical protein